MRYHDISSGFRLPISAEEQDFMSRFSEGPIDEDQLGEREGQLAHEMTIRGLLNRIDTNDKSYYEIDKIDFWRF